MKDRRCCPKCQSTDIVIIDGYTGGYGSGNMIVGMTVFSAVEVKHYICCNCGFTERWINRGDIQKVRNAARAHR